jgi:hypothetical protein
MENYSTPHEGNYFTMTEEISKQKSTRPETTRITRM